MSGVTVCKRWPTARPDPDWFAILRVGDVLQRGRHGPLRVVRDVHRYSAHSWNRHRRRQAGRLGSITFAIRHCSWTKRPYTVYTASDLKTFGYRYVGARVRLDRPIDKRLAVAIRDSTNQSLKCCAVRGLP